MPQDYLTWRLCPQHGAYDLTPARAAPNGTPAWVVRVPPQRTACLAQARDRCLHDGLGCVPVNPERAVALVAGSEVTPA